MAQDEKPQEIEFVIDVERSNASDTEASFEAYGIKLLELRARFIKRQATKLIEACSYADVCSGGPKPLQRDIEFAIGILLNSVTRAVGRPGRPSSPMVNGPYLRGLREEAGLTRKGLAEALLSHTSAAHGIAEGLDAKTIQRYENHSARGGISGLRIIASVLTKRLGRSILPEDLTFE